MIRWTSYSSSPESVVLSGVFGCSKSEPSVSESESVLSQRYFKHSSFFAAAIFRSFVDREAEDLVIEAAAGCFPLSLFAVLEVVSIRELELDCFSGVETNGSDDDEVLEFELESESESEAKSKSEDP